MSNTKSENRICQNCKKDFIIEPDDFGFYEKIKVPPPTFCPECRLKRRLYHYNKRALYKRLCAFCKKDKRSSEVLTFIGSTILILNGSIIVLNSSMSFYFNQYKDGWKANSK